MRAARNSVSDLLRERKYRAFTLIELLVVIAIIAVLAALLMPAMRTALDRAESVFCLSQLRQVAVATYQYAMDHESITPVAYDTAQDKTWHFPLWEGEYLDLPTRFAPSILVCPSFYPGVWDTYAMTYGMRLFSHRPHNLATLPERITYLLFADSLTFVQSYNGVPSQGYRIYSHEYEGARWYARPHVRHLERANIVFADGHDASCSPEDLETYAPGGYYDLDLVYHHFE